MRRGLAWLVSAAGMLAAMSMAFSAHADGGPKTPALRTPVEQMAAPPPPPPPKAEVAPAAAPTGRTGAITLANGTAFTVPAGYVFYGPDVARAYLNRIQKPAPQGEIYGIVAPAGEAPESPKFAGVVVSWAALGHVPETGGEAFAAPDFLAQVKNGRGPLAPSPEAFAPAPAHDAKRHALVWGEQFAAGSPTDQNIRHEARLLGRRGATALTGFSNAAGADAARADVAKALGALAYPAGEGYADFVTGKDQQAEYDLPGLITNIKRAGAAPPVTAAAAEAPPPAAEPGFLQRWFPWIAAALIGLPVLMWLVASRSNRAQNSAEDDDDDEADDASDTPAADPNVTPPAQPR